MDEVHRARHGGKGAELAYLLGPPPSQSSNTFTSPDSGQLHHSGFYGASIQQA